MHARVLPWVLLTMVAVGLSGCRKADVAESGAGEAPPAAKGPLVAGNLRKMKDPIDEAIYAAKLKTRQAYNSRRFDDLEKEAAQWRASKETYANGSWKLVQFYEALGCSSSEPESMWELHERIHQEWIAAKPASITARVAYADFLTDYAWHARGTEYANKVTQEGWRLFGQRLAQARKVLEEARTLNEKDPVWWTQAMTVALGQSWNKVQYDALVAEAHTFEPLFWGHDTARAYSLLPRWHGQPGDWEAFAAEAAARPGGLGIELYARILFYLEGYYGNVFQETKASWPKAREGVIVLMQKHPESLGILSEAAKLSAMAGDRVLARQLLERLGDRYLDSVWEKPEQLIKFRKWAGVE